VVKISLKVERKRKALIAQSLSLTPRKITPASPIPEESDAEEELQSDVPDRYNKCTAAVRRRGKRLSPPMGGAKRGRRENSDSDNLEEGFLFEPPEKEIRGDEVDRRRQKRTSSAQSPTELMRRAARRWSSAPRKRRTGGRPRP
jgi:hypothetical protein